MTCFLIVGYQEGGSILNYSRCLNAFEAMSHVNHVATSSPQRGMNKVCHLKEKATPYALAQMVKMMPLLLRETGEKQNDVRS